MSKIRYKRRYERFTAEIGGAYEIIGVYPFFLAVCKTQPPIAVFAMDDGSFSTEYKPLSYPPMGYEVDYKDRPDGQVSWLVTFGLDAIKTGVASHALVAESEARRFIMQHRLDSRDSLTHPKGK